MDHRSRVALAGAVLLIAPAALVLASTGIEAVTGLHTTRVANAAFAMLGVTGTSPLPVRQAWYAGTFILAPLGGAALALSACIDAGARARWQLGALSACAALIASFWTIRSLLDD
jgi:hypothetical protein